MSMPTRLTLLLCLTIALPPAFAQTPVAGTRCLILPVQDLSATDAAKDYVATITDAVRAAFSARGYTVLSDAEWSSLADSRNLDPSLAVSSGDALAIARTAGADVAVTGYFTLQNDQIHYALQAWDVAAGTLSAGLEETSPFNLAFFSALSVAMNDRLLSRITLSAKATPLVTFTSANEGMQVLIAGDLDVGRVSAGRLAFALGSVGPGTRVLVRKVLKGYHTAEETVTLVTDKDIPLKPLQKEHRAGAEASLTSGQLLGAGGAVRGYAIPDWLFLSIGGVLWVQPPATFAPRFAFHTDTSVGLGGYLFFLPDSPVRVGVSTGAGIMMTFVPALPAYADFYLNVGSWWVEAGIAGTTFYVRQEYAYALGLGTNLLGTGWMMGQFPPTTIGMLFRW